MLGSLVDSVVTSSVNASPWTQALAPTPTLGIQAGAVVGDGDGVDGPVTPWRPTALRGSGVSDTTRTRVIAG